MYIYNIIFCRGSRFVVICGWGHYKHGMMTRVQ